MVTQVSVDIQQIVSLLAWAVLRKCVAPSHLFVVSTVYVDTNELITCVRLDASSDQLKGLLDFTVWVTNASEGIILSCCMFGARQNVCLVYFSSFQGVSGCRRLI
jgi:hypothetical protein